MMMGPPVTDLTVPSVTAAEVMEGGFQVVDVRSPGEFVDGHVPGSVNHPFLDDEQRAAVGLAYAKEGASRARMVGLEQVAPGLVAYLNGLVELARSQPRGRRLAVMCWRGGERSRNVVLLLALLGVHVVTVSGGYRAYRREVLSRLREWRPPVPVVTLYGHTGSGKSALLRALAEAAPDAGRPRPWVVDLEQLALHRGSLLGGLNQPGRRRQKDFDALLWDELRHVRGDYLLLEGEGGRIGRIYLPGTVAQAVRNGLPVKVDAPLEERVARIVQEYAPERWGADEEARFRKGLGLIGGRLSKKNLHSLESAFDDGRFTDVVRELLVVYYDPLYRKSSVEGRDFVWEFQTSSDPRADAHRFVRGIGPIIREVL
jgi:tRNA 2-selenouridine synthase